jgi:C_GCAxxG_C_C family probable redox protein
MGILSPNKESNMDNRTEIAVSKFVGGYNCAQSVLYAFCDELQIDKEMALKMACGFGAGMGRKEEVCGAVTGAIMAIGVKYGRGEHDDKPLTEQTYQKTRVLIDQFTQRQGEFVCRRLLGGCDLTTEEGQKLFKENDLLNKVCKQCVQSAVEITSDIIERG